MLKRERLKKKKISKYLAALGPSWDEESGEGYSLTDPWVHHGWTAPFSALGSG